MKRADPQHAQLSTIQCQKAEFDANKLEEHADLIVKSLLKHAHIALQTQLDM